MPFAFANSFHKCCCCCGSWNCNTFCGRIKQRSNTGGSRQQTENGTQQAQQKRQWQHWRWWWKWQWERDNHNTDTGVEVAIAFNLYKFAGAREKKNNNNKNETTKLSLAHCCSCICVSVHVAVLLFAHLHVWPVCTPHIIELRQSRLPLEFIFCCCFPLCASEFSAALLLAFVMSLTPFWVQCNVTHSCMYAFVYAYEHTTPTKWIRTGI